MPSTEADRNLENIAEREKIITTCKAIMVFTAPNLGVGGEYGREREEMLQEARETLNGEGFDTDWIEEDNEKLKSLSRVTGKLMRGELLTEDEKKEWELDEDKIEKYKLNEEELAKVEARRLELEKAERRSVVLACRDLETLLAPIPPGADDKYLSTRAKANEEANSRLISAGVEVRNAFGGLPTANNQEEAKKNYEERKSVVLGAVRAMEKGENITKNKEDILSGIGLPKERQRKLRLLNENEKEQALMSFREKMEEYDITNGTFSERDLGNILKALDKDAKLYTLLIANEIDLRIKLRNRVVSHIEVDGWPSGEDERLRKIRGIMAEWFVSDTQAEPLTCNLITETGGHFVNNLVQLLSPEKQKDVRKEEEVLKRLRRMNTSFREAHTTMPVLAERVKSEVLPDKNDMVFLLNQLRDENGVEGAGGKMVAKAIQIYRHMADLQPEERISLQAIDPSFPDVQIENIFNNKAIPADREAQVRADIARACGGEYYRAIGESLVMMMGYVARASNSATNGSNADCLGVMMYPHVSNPEVTSTVTAAWRGIFPPVVVKAYREDSQETIGLAADIGSLQFLNGDEDPSKRAFYVVQQGDRFVLKQNLRGNETESDYTLDDLIKQGRLSEVDFGKSEVDLMGIQHKANEAVVDLYGMMSCSLSKAKERWETNPDTISRNIQKALPHLTPRERRKVAYRYIFGLIEMHTENMLKISMSADMIQKSVWSSVEILNLVSSCVKSGLISENQGKTLREFYAKKEMVTPARILRGILGR